MNPPATIRDDARTHSEQQHTYTPHGHILTHAQVWSPDGRWLVYDVRSDAMGEVFDGSRIEAVDTLTGEIRVLHQTRHGAHCGVATFSAASNQVAFIRGPQHPTGDWSYAPYHREGIVVKFDQVEAAAGNEGSDGSDGSNLDARDIVAPYTPGALRGGTHVHLFSADGRWVSFTYEDHVLATAQAAGQTSDAGPLGAAGQPGIEPNQRNVGISIAGRPVCVPRSHQRNHDGTHFSMLVTRTHASPVPGSDQIQRACEEAWVGTHGYHRPDSTRQRRALAFQGEVITAAGLPIREVFVVDLPDDLIALCDEEIASVNNVTASSNNITTSARNLATSTASPDHLIQGTASTMPRPPRGITQRRLTFTHDRKHPGIQGPRHWLRSSPDGQRIAFLMKDDAGVVQLFTVQPWAGQAKAGPSQGGHSKGGQAQAGPSQPGDIQQVTHIQQSIASAFTWHPDGSRIACVIDRSVCTVDVVTGQVTRLTQRTANEAAAPSPLACVYSPDGRRIAYLRKVGGWTQVFTVGV